LVGNPEGKRPLIRHWRRLEADKKKWTLRNKDGVSWIGLIWLRIEVNGELLCSRQWAFGLHTIRETSWLAEELFPHQGKLWHMDLFSWLLNTVFLKLFNTVILWSNVGLYRSNEYVKHWLGRGNEFIWLRRWTSSELLWAR
jgi:hypothetical protein